MYGLEVNFITGRFLNLFTNKHFCRFYTCIQNQIIHKHVHVDYNPLKDMLVINIVNCPLCSLSRKSRLFEDSMAIYGCQTASQVSLLVGFLISWISLPTKTTKIGATRIKVISQYTTLHKYAVYQL